MTANTERLDVEKEMFKSLTRLKASRLSIPHSDDLLAVEQGIDLLLQRLAELEAEVERLRGKIAEGVPALLKLEKERAEAAERARDEACGLLREAFDSIKRCLRLLDVDITKEPEPDTIGGRIAAFLAANAADEEGKS